jgi:translation initiation factor 1 (eIF-1/SUI1)
MDEFNEFNDFNEFEMKDIIINIWVEATGRKKNTFLSGWDLTDHEFKQHIKNIKKKNGCNGSVKDKIIQLQGDHINYLKSYLTENIKYNHIIKIRGV